MQPKAITVPADNNTLQDLFLFFFKPPQHPYSTWIHVASGPTFKVGCLIYPQNKSQASCTRENSALSLWRPRSSRKVWTFCGGWGHGTQCGHIRLPPPGSAMAVTPLVYLIQLRENVASEAIRPTPASACTCEPRRRSRRAGEGRREEVISRSEDSEVPTARFFLRKEKKNKTRSEPSL